MNSGRVSVMCIAAILMMAGMASARTVWLGTVADPNSAIPAANWNDPANWDAGVPVLVPEEQNTAGKAVFYGTKPECQVTTPDAECWYLVLGDNEPCPNPLRVMDGGIITTGDNWSGVGYNEVATLIVEEGGTVNFGDHLWIGLNAGADGRVVLNGGTITVANALDWGRNDGALGTIELNAGLLHARYLPDNSSRGVCDIKFGTFAITNNYATPPSPLWDRINEGSIVGFGGLGTLNVERVDGLTLVTAVHPMNPSPAYDAIVEVPEGPVAPVDLSWTNVDPNTPGRSVYVDVWFGTEPNKLSLAYTKEVAAGENTTTVQVNAPVNGGGLTQYYWQVDSYIYGDPALVNYANAYPADANSLPVIEGDVFQFFVTDDFPPTVTIETLDTVTWPGEPVQLNATVNDTGSSALTIQWTSDPDGAVFSPSANVEDPVVTVASAVGEMVLTCSVSDAFNPEINSETMLLNVAADACEAAGIAGVAADYPMDVAEPFCVIDIADLAVIGADWLLDYTLQVPTEIP